MKKRVLFVATTAKTHINTFHQPYILWFKEQNWNVDVATNGDAKVPFADNEYFLSIERSPYSVKNLKALIELIKIMKRQKYDLISCHTPIGGVLTRIAAKFTGTKPVLYMAHGFHFYKGAPVINNLLYKTVEQFLARWTDVLVTINSEDYTAAKAFTLRKGGVVYHTPGIGANTTAITDFCGCREKKLAMMGLQEDSFIVLTVAELTPDKNIAIGLDAFYRAALPNAIYLICGTGKLEKELMDYAQSLGLGDRVRFLGYRNDICEIVNCADVFLFPSKREGLSVAVIEAMSAGLPILASKIRGNVDLIDSSGGILLDAMDSVGFSEGLKYLYNHKDIRKAMGIRNRDAAPKYNLDNAKQSLTSIYFSLMRKVV